MLRDPFLCPRCRKGRLLPVEDRGGRMVAVRPIPRFSAGPLRGTPMLPELQPVELYRCDMCGYTGPRNPN